jgi:ABC-type Zn uptake system ZnuABC Zn-binding protein ZnuA
MSRRPAMPRPWPMLPFWSSTAPGLEGWMSRLQKSSGFKGTVVTATKGIKSRQVEEDEHNKTRKITHPHAWQSLASGKIYVHNIRDGLIAADPAGKDATRRTPVSSWSISRTSRRP